MSYLQSPKQLDQEKERQENVRKENYLKTNAEAIENDLKNTCFPGTVIVLKFPGVDIGNWDEHYVQENALDELLCTEMRLRGFHSAHVQKRRKYPNSQNNETTWDYLVLQHPLCSTESAVNIHAPAFLHFTKEFTVDSVRENMLKKKKDAQLSLQKKLAVETQKENALKTRTVYLSVFGWEAYVVPDEVANIKSVHGDAFNVEPTYFSDDPHHLNLPSGISLKW